MTANTFWLKQSNWADFAKYEEAVNNVIGRHRMLAVCTCSLQKCNKMEILDVLPSHPFALLNNFAFLFRTQAENVDNEWVRNLWEYRKILDYNSRRKR